MAYGSKKISSVAIKMALTETREEEAKAKQQFLEIGIKTAAVDVGGEYLSSIKKIVERAIYIFTILSCILGNQNNLFGSSSN